MLAGAAIGLGSSLLQGLTGLIQSARGRKLAKQNVRPTQEVQQEFYQNANLAKNMAQVGLPQQQYNNALGNINRNMGAATRLLQSRANPLAGINNLLRSTNDATLQLDAQDASARMSNQRNLMQQNAILGQQKQNAWNWNKRDLYGEKLAESQAMKAAGMQNIAGALGTMANMGIMSTEGQNFGNLGGLFGNKRKQLGSGFGTAVLASSGLPYYG